ncbi:uncharacterized protein LOC116853047 [Odontomachus brunneus]|uniref:uncharacterized protein LOC116853047 n=1 Tax=Odontomachus brunneus TaxID=486640 RepID=UPI0013F1F9CB|nr:uncharacterized protein LOC116853047 [Odontomachus brunneus]
MMGMDRAVRKLGVKKRAPRPDVTSVVAPVTVVKDNSDKRDATENLPEEMDEIMDIDKILEVESASEIDDEEDSDEGWRDALEMDRLAVDQVVNSLKRMGLKVTPQKTEIMFMHDGSRMESPRAQGRIDNVSVKTGPTLKVANMLGSLLPKLGGPKRKARRLYDGIVHSMALYGAPVWSGEMATNPCITALGYRAQRIGKKFNSRCHHCGAEVDLAQHILEECSSRSAESWSEWWGRTSPLGPYQGHIQTRRDASKWFSAVLQRAFLKMSMAHSSVRTCSQTMTSTPAENTLEAVLLQLQQLREERRQESQEQ